MQPSTPEQIKLVVETALLSSSEPLQMARLRRMFDSDPGAEMMRKVLVQLQEDWQGRGVVLVRVAGGWRFQTRTEFQPYLNRVHESRPPRYSRAALETLAIIAYRQPVTRGDIEQLRGVAVSPNVLRNLESRGWIDVVGHRDTPGRPALFATTDRFLDDLGLCSLTELPPMVEIERIMDLVDNETITPPDAAPQQEEAR